MTAIDIKTDLHKLIDKVQDINVLNAIRVILFKQLDKRDVDFWDELSVEQKASVEKGLVQANKGELKSHKEVIKKYKKWLQ